MNVHWQGEDGLARCGATDGLLTGDVTKLKCPACLGALRQSIMTDIDANAYLILLENRIELLETWKAEVDDRLAALTT